MTNSKTIVFLSTCASVDYYTKLLTAYFKGKENQNIYGIHGKLKTRRRKRIIEEFFGQENGVLFATDVVSRGIDFEYVHFILQADPPEDPDNYIHRIGRTARVNRPGTVLFHLFRPFF
jgi:ATP-dependent RNA helicase DDX55/SPB4